MGRNNVGRLGISDATVKFSTSPLLVEGVSNVSLVRCGGNHSCCLTDKNVLFTWGSTSIGQGTRDISFVPREPNFQTTRQPEIVDLTSGPRSIAFVTAKG